MRQHFCLLLIALVCSATPPHAAATCIHADIGVDAAHRAITMRLTLPRDVHSLKLVPLDGYHRSKLWRSPDGSAIVTDSGLRAADPLHRRLQVTMDVQTNLDKPDRTYPPFLRFADGTVAVDTDTFASDGKTPSLCSRFTPPRGEQVIGNRHAANSPWQAPAHLPAAYVAFGTPRVEHIGSLTLVSDRKVPEWVRARLHTGIPAIAEFYRQRMGPMQLPVVFLYQLAGTHQDSGYHGDRLPGSVTLGLIGDAWKIPDADAVHQITRFVAHELFHVWNADRGLEPVSNASNLASEGGADLASMFTTALVEGKGQAAWLDAASTSLDSCLLGLPDSGKLAGHLDLGQLPYYCGVPVMLVLGAMHDPRDPLAGYFRAWKALIGRQRHATGHQYRWSDLAPTDGDPTVLAALDRAVNGDHAYPVSIRQALEQVGFVLKRRHTPTDDIRVRLNRQLMATLMANDCNGRVSFWSQPEGFLLDQPLPECRTLAPGRKVISLLGQPLATNRPDALAAAIRARCKAGGKLTVGYADGSAGSSLGCPAKPVSLPALWQIVGYTRP